ncbi:hypothetical protein LTR99_008685 [Exophiala xenobiotica]|uniref:Tetrapyrrole biosynthesis uroporphyrinogen III synthase domain-containing protein n=1 Tax=Vermiconidia calcicola TaxID=1690605 RepID=A0AAV9Q0I5_9PEZI|nr:hypothetical protein H2202_004923 [Exophiala xenobiotica]KAK5533330.1 hypothetical protein LTR25_007195 [Vermiconidia calcicola]KAK5534284.1 hypothetical protein LTR23_008834 [Chaetothyriales sp. CCFEE 6169]KAK5189369.1 hypothetical protein LTR92_010697 [Exophiala xenobiotica]KAK5205787.1 hypothetical protein LTR41_008468 [Exophiala xenobiotica]
MSKPSIIPVLLLKTRSLPHDGYEEFFSTPSSATDGGRPIFQPQFAPVLEHRPNAKSLAVLEDLLKSGHLADKYGGMIFTSQRAVEAWADVAKRVEQEAGRDEAYGTGTGVTTSNGIEDPTQDTTSQLVEDDFSFPFYTVGPATSRALKTLIETSSSSPNKWSPLARLRPVVLGEHTGNGGSLAEYILSHYNELHARRQYTFYEAPRLPFTPILGPSQGERLDKDDERIQKKGLLFLVGEQRRDIIPKTLMDAEGKLDPQKRIQVDEVEVYRTQTMASFQDEFQRRIDSIARQGSRFVVVVVFSPQGCESMLRSLEYIDHSNVLTERARNRWAAEIPEDRLKPIIVTIGPTTRDHLKDNYGFDADICATKPSPQGLGNGLDEFLRRKSLV